MKAVNHSWWIGAIISTVLTFVFLGNDSSLNVGVLLFMGIVSGAFWGWLIGLIIDKFWENKKTSSSKTSGKISKDDPESSEVVNQTVSPPLNKQYSSESEDTNGPAFLPYETIVKDIAHSNKVMITEFFQQYLNNTIYKYIDKNKNSLNDPIFSSMKIMNLIQITSEEIKPKLMQIKGNLSENDVDNIIKEVNSKTVEKIFD
ncbi:hypothetical protein LDL76_06005 [Salegentibacter mishustinae]|jgi:hypothetical protein|uniref:hypothetical protein n=1 Tax=Salegentibacter mishustinae TaxID=270918 RepID=UPI001CE0D06E|nr:hypothetical protein [Salegentibacter mishustinae]UBZ08261.1 hypothetical protein LDL76_06005 [Salegentibacter mishustinae]